MDLLAFIRDIAALMASLAVLFGVNAWRRDFVGKRQIELAEEVLSLFYRARDAISHMRSPMAYSTESEHIVPVDGESPDRTHARRSVAPLYKRYEGYSELFADIHAARYRFMARFGDDDGKPFDDLRKTLNEIFVAADMMVMTAGDSRSDDARQRWLSYTNKVWGQGEDDQITLKVNAAVRNLEEICRHKTGTQSVFILLFLKLKRWLNTQQWYRTARDWLVS